MYSSVDVSGFQIGVQPSEDAEEALLLEGLAVEARHYIESRPWAPPIADLLLAFGVGGIIGLFLVRFEREMAGEIAGEKERWVVVGDLPSMNFETEDAPRADLALCLYCAIAQDWAETVMSGGDLSDSYPIPIEPTEEHAEMLISRIKFIRSEIIPLAERHLDQGRTAIKT